MNDTQSVSARDWDASRLNKRNQKRSQLNHLVYLYENGWAKHFADAVECYWNNAVKWQNKKPSGKCCCSNRATNSQTIFYFNESTSSFQCYQFALQSTKHFRNVLSERCSAYSTIGVNMLFFFASIAKFDLFHLIKDSRWHSFNKRIL